MAIGRSILTGSGLAKFTVLVALFAILADASVGHGLTWENDPYWTYWITKTFLIATVFGLGTAWFGLGVKRGAAITAVHTLILTVYYWSLSPIGLPSSPEWLNLEHTWITGLPIHFGVIFLGYLLALWVWQRQAVIKTASKIALSQFGWKSLAMSLAIVVVAGGLSNLALSEFTGLSWYVTRLLITLPFVMLWRGLVGRDRLASVVGGIVLALIWATYSQYLGPGGLPDLHNLRLWSQDAPPAPVHWLGYNQLWLISFPIYITSMVSLLLLGSYQSLGLSLKKPLMMGALAVATVSLVAGLAIPDKSSGATAHIFANGQLVTERGAYYDNKFSAGIGRIDIMATDAGNRVSPLPPHDSLKLSADIRSGGHRYHLTAERAMVDDPLGEFTTWWGVGLDVLHHGRSGIGSGKLPVIDSRLAVFGMGDLMMDGKLLASGVAVHAMTAEKGLAGNRHLELDVGDSRMPPIAGLPGGHLRVLWPDYKGQIPGHSAGRYWGGGAVLLASVLSGLWLNSPRRKS